MTDFGKVGHVIWMSDERIQKPISTENPLEASDQVNGCNVIATRGGKRP